MGQPITELPTPPRPPSPYGTPPGAWAPPAAPPYPQGLHPQGPYPQGQYPPAGYPGGPFPFAGPAPLAAPHPRPLDPARRSKRLGVLAGAELVVIIGLAVALIISLATRPSSNSASASGPSALTAPPTTSPFSTPPVSPGDDPITATPASALAGSIAYQSSFARSDGWQIGKINDKVSAVLADNAYVVTGTGSVHHLISTPDTDASTSVSVTTVVTAYPSDGVTFGPACQTATESLHVYQFVLGPDGVWFLEEADPGGTVTDLYSGTVEPPSSTVTVELSCVSRPPTGGLTYTHLIGYVDGQPAVEYDAVQADLPSGGWVPGLVVSSYGTTVSATFTHLTVRNLPHSS